MFFGIFLKIYALRRPRPPFFPGLGTALESLLEAAVPSCTHPLRVNPRRLQDQISRGKELSTQASLFSFSLEQPIENIEVLRTAAAIRQRHPSHRRCGLEKVIGKLRTITSRIPEPERAAVLQYIDIQHSKMCRSEDWTKDKGQWCKSLEAWLNPANRLWENEPRRMVQTDMDRLMASRRAQGIVA